MADAVKGIRARRIEADYYKVGTATDFSFMGTGFLNIDESPDAQVVEKRYVCDASSSKSVNKYNWSADLTADQIKNDAVIEDIVNIGKELKTGADCEREYMKVDLDKPATEEGSYYARKFRVSVQVTGYTDNDGELQVAATLGGLGDPVIGTAKITTTNGVSKATFTEKFSPKASE